MGNPKELHFIQVMVVIDLDNFKRYAKTIENSLAEEQRRFDSHVEKEAAKWQGQDIDEFYSIHATNHWRLSKVFPDLLRASFFVTSYSFLEHRLLEICRYFQKNYTHTVGLADLKGRGIFKAQIYLKKVVGIDFPDQSSLWKEIVTFNHIRNFIVHNDGQINTSNHATEVKSFIDKKNWISIDTQGHIQFTGNFYQEIIDILRKFFDELFVALSKIQVPQL